MRATILSCVFGFINVLTVTSQNIYIHTTDSSIHTYQLVDVNSITFDESVMKLNLVSLDTVSWNFSTIDYYNYDQWFVSVEEGLVLSSNGISIYPNPTSAEFYIKYELIETAKVQLEILDLTGRLVETRQLGNQNAGPQQVTVSLKHSSAVLSSGTYVCRIGIGNTVFNKLFIFKK